MEKAINAKRTIGVIMQRNAHILRYKAGLRYLEEKEKEGSIIVHSVNIYDIGSDSVMLANLLERLRGKVDVLIVDHALYELVGGYLQHELGDTSTVVLGFVVPPFYTTDWFLPVCQRAVEDPVLEVVKLPRWPRHERSLAETIVLIEKDESETVAPKSA